MITQTDLVLRSALALGLQDLRRRPYLLDDIFSQAAQDPFLTTEFGYAEIERAKKWFLGVNIPVVMQHRLDSAEMPSISIALLSSGERIPETLLGDYGSGEEVDDTQVFDQDDVTFDPIVVLGPFTPQSYDPATGTVTLPTGFTTDFVMPGQMLVDRPNNTAYPILVVTGTDTFTIAPDTTADFTDAIVIPRFQTMGLVRNRSMFTETYQIGCHVAGDPVELLWLHSIVVFCLLRYKEAYLDARGLTRTTFSSSDFLRSPQYEPQNIFSRYITMSAVVEENWIADVSQKVEGIKLNKLKVIDGGTTPPAYFEEQVKDQQWDMEDDPVDS